ncbi:hypothetical protein COT75_01455 [Candidatus Beckwithbacteria bacterium CG10_big_fil_rev_8_21_14_0_10_34_10]|uniref:HTH luxR-type domain-containing protein n=1 Tax=Candidatus Beckwithbacteria bacterium CG10_big_fil_rev_8_21_14_0_10_34_10 TaxID=1974495 RepID=A0A2H0W9Y6_9BACT|nr:MAG: hypothetical protein COT75_01455 [Candidatus Beckwithbacteria bacterium CG10_big_fil_rev_8_21_14_0_10_34_10]
MMDLKAKLFYLLTVKEKVLLEKRLKVFRLLKTNLTYREIAKRLKLSTTTVVNLNKRLKLRKGIRVKTKLKYSARIVEKKSLPWVIG